MARDKGLLSPENEGLVEGWLTFRPSEDYLSRARSALLKLTEQGDFEAGEVVEMAEAVGRASGGLWFRVSADEKEAIREIAEVLSKGLAATAHDLDPATGEASLVPWDDEATDSNGFLAASAPMVAPAPASVEGPARLVVLSDEHPGEYSLDSGNIRVGRRAHNDIRVNWDKRVSREHCRIFVKEGAWFASDNGSNNGTFVDGEQVIERQLFGGEEIRVGDTWLRFEIGRASA